MEKIDDELYFCIHAPRQSGKTTCLKALIRQINSEGKYYAFYCSLATLRETKDPATGMKYIAGLINDGLDSSDIPEISDLAYSFEKMPYMAYPVNMVKALLKSVCNALDRELVVFFDEADCLHEEPLVMFLGQIRQGYIDRDSSPASRFPKSLALVGMRNIRDYLYRVRPEEKSMRLPSPFNIIESSLSLGDFTRDDVGALYGQHTDETGQVFEPSAIDQALLWTEGQPWLVNALAKDVIVGRFQKDYSRAVTGLDIDLAAQDMLLRNEIHFDSLLERLKEPRVRRVIEPVVTGARSLPEGISEDDVAYVIDLGIMKMDPGNEESLRASNLFYGELIVRSLTRKLQKNVPAALKNQWMDGAALDMDGLLRAFQVYWRENSEVNELTEKEKMERHRLLKTRVAKSLTNTEIADKFDIHEDIVKIIKDNLSGFEREDFPHIVLFAFMQRVLNGGADFVQREYGLGRTFVDICVSYNGIRYPVELKVKGAMAREESVAQVLGYMDKSGSSAGWLVVFDRDSAKTWEEKLTWETLDRGGKAVRVVGC
ncbi:MAG: hypothetical protein LBQ12_05160 [Deltaproteobacteria bacterium]|nr:hypothetical protein [Deltaproteobacteria bacterium]